MEICSTLGPRRARRMTMSLYSTAVARQACTVPVRRQGRMRYWLLCFISLCVYALALGMPLHSGGDVETQAPLRLLAACGLEITLATRCLCTTIHRPKDLTYCSNPACSHRVSSSLHVGVRVN